jgi:hypothetical protein
VKPGSYAPGFRSGGHTVPAIMCIGLVFESDDTEHAYFVSFHQDGHIVFSEARHSVMQFCHSAIQFEPEETPAPCR